MKLTKYQHACLVLEKEGTTLVIDPGTFSHDFIPPARVDGIIITHEHPDHFDDELMSLLLERNPKAVVVGHESITARFSDHPTLPALIGQEYTLGSFTLRFFGGTHAAIDDSIQVPPNLGVLVDNRLYYPGDSFFVPENTPISELALPVSAPWLSIRDTLYFLKAVRPAFAFPTHDAILSSDGKAVVDRMVTAVASAQSTHYKRLDGSSITLS